MIRVINGLNLKSTTRRVICLYRMIADKFSLPGNSESVKELLHWAILPTCLTISLRLKLHKKMPSATSLKTNMTRNVSVAASVATIICETCSFQGLLN